MDRAVYEKIPKGRGYVYVHDSHLYQRVKTKNDTLYLKCYVANCDGLAKLKNDVFSLGVSSLIPAVELCCAGTIGRPTWGQGHIFKAVPD